MKTFDQLLSAPLQPPDREATRREQFRQANASEALEGLQMDDEDLAIQERIVTGELTPEQAVEEYRARARRGV